MSIYERGPGPVARSQSIILLSLVSAVVAAGACSLTIDLDDITGGVPSTGGGGQGGFGGAQVECTGPSDCPQAESPCEGPICIGGECGVIGQPWGTELPGDYQTDDDCLVQICDGAGNEVAQNDDEDHPASTGCVTYECTSGILVEEEQLVGASCDGDGVCDADGSCVECIVPGDCTHLPEDDDCQTRTCEDGQCGQDFTADLTPISLQTAGDCRETVCDGAGGTKDEPKDDDTPDDGNECTVDSCNPGLGTPNFQPKVNGTQCGNGMSCVGGMCTGCNNNPSLCPGQDTYCRERTCVNDTCGWSFINAGNALPVQTPNDCQRDECDNQGNVITVADGTDLPLPDTNECTGEACSNGSAQWPDLPLDTPCNGSTQYCDGAGSCVACNSPSQCSAADCHDPTCVAHQCGDTFTTAGQPSPTQQSYDCQVVLCDGSGGTYEDAQDTDLPFDGNQCTLDVCSNGTPSNPPAPLGSHCSSGGVACNGSGTCVECAYDIHCNPAWYCSGVFKCMPDQDQGATCTSASQCQSGHCADGFCCDKACGGMCEACDTAKTHSPSGVCAPIIGLTDPDNECPGTSVCFETSCCQPKTVSPSPQSVPNGHYPAIPDCPAMPQR